MAERKILIVTNRVPYPLKDGGNIARNAMIEGYHSAGWQVFLLSMNTSRHYIPHDHLDKLFTQLYRFQWVDVDNRLRWPQILSNFVFSRQPEHAVRFYSNEFRRTLVDALTTFKPDVVQVESVYLSTYLPEIRKHSAAVTVLRLHNIEYQIWQGLIKKQGILKKMYFSSLTERIRNFERAAWRQYDLLLPITEKDANLVNRLEPVRHMVVAPFSVDFTKIKKPAQKERWVGYHIGAMDWIANRDGIRWFLNNAWPGIHKAVPSFEFYFAGRKMPREFTDMSIDGVHCLDEVPNAEEFISDKKILIVPLWSGGGIRVKILEAMAAGKIVITTRVGIKGIEAQTGEHYLLARNAEDFATCVKWCFDNKVAAEQMAQKASMLIQEKYEQRTVMNKVLQEIDTILQMET